MNIPWAPNLLTNRLIHQQLLDALTGNATSRYKRMNRTPTNKQANNGGATFQVIVLCLPPWSDSRRLIVVAAYLTDKTVRDSC